MKKQILFATSIVLSGALFAQAVKKESKIPSNLSNICIKKNKNVTDIQNNISVSYQASAQRNSLKNISRVSAMTEDIIGNTYYDLQSNSSVGERIVVNADGTIATCWTFEGTADGGVYANRGTGYAYYNGTAWSAIPTVRVENTRVGWGNIVNTRSGKELILSHTGGLLNLATRPNKGTGTWNNSTTTVPTATTGGNFWPRMVSSNPRGGDTLYAISLTYPTSQGGALWQGLDGAVVFSRSINGGTSWDIVNQVPTGLTSATFRGFGGDAYAITAKGSTVAIVAGDSDKNVVMTKSTDGGVTWTAKTVLQFPIPLWDYTTTTSDVNGDNVADTIATNDGNFGIAMDNFGKVYVSYGAYRLLNDAPSASGYSYFPYTDGLYLWDESMPQNAGGNLVAGIEDLGEQGTIYFPTPGTGLLAFGSFGASLTSYSNLAFDASNTLYLSYSSVVDSLLSITSDPRLVRHTYVIKSTNGGATFTDPYDVVPRMAGTEYEGMYPNMAKNVNGFVHLIYQRDFYPGYAVPPSTGTDADPDNVDSQSDIIYVKIPVSEIMGNSGSLGVKENSSLVSNLNFYPNPASSNGTIEVVLKETTKMDLSIVNSVGQTVYSNSISGNIGSNKIDVNLNNLSSGLYFYQVKVGNSNAITKKFTVQK